MIYDAFTSKPLEGEGEVEVVADIEEYDVIEEPCAQNPAQTKGPTTEP